MPQVVTWIMVILISLVVGFLGGWLLEYYLDLKYLEIRARKRGFLPPKETTDLVDTTVPTGDEGSKAGASTDEQWAASLHELQKKHEAEINTIRRAVRIHNARYDDLETQFEQYITTHPDDLTAIRGIERAYQWRLRDAGISSYSRLANTTPKQLCEILGVPDWQKLELESWIEQAKVLAQRGK